MHTMVILSAPWVVPVEVTVIRDGSIVIADGLIIDIGKRNDIMQKYPYTQEISYPCVLLPGLVNAHMHLELSHFEKNVTQLPKQNFTDWIDTLIEQRSTQKISREAIVAALTTALNDQYKSGVVLIGDIGNEYFDELYSRSDRYQPKIVRMLEYLGPTVASCRSALDNLGQLDDHIAATGHAPYSTAPDLLIEIKKRCNRFQHTFSVHVSESEEEREFIQTGTGIFREFLEKKKRWDGTFSFTEYGFSGTVEYFDYLGLLDKKTLLVHCVHVNENEIKLLKERGCHICLCPGSNRFLGVGCAPVEQMVASGILPALGSDSPASNTSTDIWREMQILTLDHPTLAPADILAMATIGGAESLAVEKEFGSLAIGKSANLIHVSSANLKRCNDISSLLKELVSGGKPTEIQWVLADHELAKNRGISQ